MGICLNSGWRRTARRCTLSGIPPLGFHPYRDSQGLPNVALPFPKYNGCRSSNSGDNNNNNNNNKKKKKNKNRNKNQNSWASQRVLTSFVHHCCCTLSVSLCLFVFVSLSVCLYLCLILLPGISVFVERGAKSYLSITPLEKLFAISFCTFCMDHERKKCTTIMHVVICSCRGFQVIRLVRFLDQMVASSETNKIKTRLAMPLALTWYDQMCRKLRQKMQAVGPLYAKKVSSSPKPLVFVEVGHISIKEAKQWSTKLHNSLWLCVHQNWVKHGISSPPHCFPNLSKRSTCAEAPT